MNQMDMIRGLGATVDQQAKLIADLAKEVATLQGVVQTARDGEAMAMAVAQTAREEVSNLLTATAGFGDRIDALEASLAAFVEEVRGQLNGLEDPPEGVPEDETDEQRATRVGLIARVVDVESLVHGRNRSAPIKRNMTDADARRVLTGDVKDLGHKEAGEAIGLTYAQVYSCRLEYTFKHVHKELREGGWKNTWAAKK